MSRKPLHLVAVQPKVSVEDFLTKEALQAKLDGLAAQIRESLMDREAGDGLVVFPEYFCSFFALTDQEALRGVDLSHMTVDKAIEKLVMKKPFAFLQSMIQGKTTKTNEAVFYMLTPHIHNLILEVFSKLASSLHATVVAGSALLCKVDPATAYAKKVELLGSDFYNTSYVFSPHGQWVSTYRKVNMVPTQEDVLGLTAAKPEEQTLHEAPFGKMGVLICYDGFGVPHSKHEMGFVCLSRNMAEQGARVLAWPSANPWPWEEPWVFDPDPKIRLRSRQWDEEGIASILSDLKSVEAVVNPHLVGQVLDAHFDGQSSIMVKTDHGVEVVAKANRHDDEEVLTYTLA